MAYGVTGTVTELLLSEVVGGYVTASWWSERVQCTPYMPLVSKGKLGTRPGRVCRTRARAQNETLNCRFDRVYRRGNLANPSALIETKLVLSVEVYNTIRELHLKKDMAASSVAVERFKVRV
jgi:hypothetical protein